MFEYIKLLYYLVRPRTIFVSGVSKALGESVLLSLLLPHLRRKNPRHRIVVKTRWGELFENNPHVDWVTNKHFKTTGRFIKPKYHINRSSTKSMLEQMLAYVEETEPSFPRVYLTAREIEEFRSRYPSPYIAVAPTGKTSFCANRKEWGVENFQRVRDLLGGLSFVQIGIPADRLLEEVIDARGLSAREAAIVIKNSIFFLGLEGGLMHLARAVDTPSVIIYGGYIHPDTVRYEGNLVFYSPVDCSPCYDSDRRQDTCESMKCMKMIGPETVYEGIMKRYGGILKDEDRCIHR